MDPAIVKNRRHVLPIKQKICHVKNCQSSIQIHNRRLSFHNFPKANTYFINWQNEQGDIETIDKLEAWKIAIGVDKISPAFKICSLHFRKDDYFFPEIDAIRRCLKKSAIPTLSVPNDKFKSLYVVNIQSQVECIDHPKTSSTSNVLIKEEVEFVSIKSEPLDEMLIDENIDFSSNDDFEKFQHSTVEEDQCDIKMVEDVGVQVNEYDLKTFENCAIQVDSMNALPEIYNFIENEKDLNTLTGIPSFEALKAVVQSVIEEFGDNYEKAQSEMKTQDRIIMTCAKIKHNLSYSFLTIMFRKSYKKMAYSTCRNICIDMIKVLYECFQKTTRNLTVITLKCLNLEKYKNMSKDA